MKKLLILIGFMLVALFLATRVGAAKLEKNEWCHCAASGVCNTLDLPQQALEQAGHVNAQGNPLHAGDHPGACIEPSSTVTPTIDPTGTPTILPTPTIWLTVTPTFTVTPRLSVTPSPQPSPQATATPAQQLEVRTLVVPKGPPATGYGTM